MTHPRTVSFSDEAAMAITKSRNRSESVNSYFERTSIQRYPAKMSFQNNSNLKSKCNLATLNWLIPRLDLALWRENLDDALHFGQIHRSLLLPLQFIFEGIARFRILPLQLDDFASNSADISVTRWLLTSFGGLELWKDFAKMISRHIVIPVLDARKNGRTEESLRKVDWLYYYFGMLEEDGFFCELGGPLLEGQARSSREPVSCRRGIEEDDIREIKRVLKKDIWEAINDVESDRGECAWGILQATNPNMEWLNAERPLELYQPPPRAEVARTIQAIKEGCSNLEKLMRRQKRVEHIQYGSAPVRSVQLHQSAARENTTMEESHGATWKRAEMAARIEAEAVQSRIDDNARRELATTSERAKNNARREAAAAKERAVENAKRQARALDVVADTKRQEQSAKTAAAKRVAESYQEESREVARALAQGDFKELERDLRVFQDDHRRHQRTIEERISAKNKALQQEQARTREDLKYRLDAKRDSAEKEVQLRALQIKHEQELKELKKEYTREMNAFYVEQDKKSAAFVSKAVEYARRPPLIAEAEPRRHQSRRRVSNVSVTERDNREHRSLQSDSRTQEIDASVETASASSSSSNPRRESRDRPSEERSSPRQSAPESRVPYSIAFSEATGLGGRIRAAISGHPPAQIEQAKWEKEKEKEKETDKERSGRRRSSSPRRSSSRRYSLEPRTGEDRRESTRRNSMEPRRAEDNRSSSRRHSVEPSSEPRREDGRRERLELPVRRESSRRNSLESRGRDEKKERSENLVRRESSHRTSVEPTRDDRPEHLEVPSRRESTRRYSLSPRREVDRHERRASYSPRRTRSPELEREDGRRQRGPTSPRWVSQPTGAPTEVSDSTAHSEVLGMSPKVNTSSYGPSPAHTTQVENVPERERPLEAQLKPHPTPGPERRPRGHSTSSIPKNYELRVPQIYLPVGNQETKSPSPKLPPYIISHRTQPREPSPPPSQREFYSRPLPGPISVSQRPTVSRNPPSPPKPRRLSPEEIRYAEANAKIAARQPLPRSPGDHSTLTFERENRIPPTLQRDEAPRNDRRTLEVPEARLAPRGGEWRQSQPGPHEPAPPTKMPEKGILRNGGMKEVEGERERELRNKNQVEFSASTEALDGGERDVGEKKRR